MAYFAADAILTRVREVVEDSAGILRTVTVGRFAGDLSPGLPEQEASRRALVTPRFDVQMRNIDNAKVLNTVNRQTLWAVSVRIRVIRDMYVKHKLYDDVRDDVVALANQDGDILAQALSYPGNLASTSGGTSTGLVGGKLELETSTHTVNLDDNSPQFVETIHVFNGFAMVSQGDGQVMYTLHSTADAGHELYTSGSNYILRGSNTMTWAYCMYLNAIPPGSVGVTQPMASGSFSSGSSIYMYSQQEYILFRITDGTGSVYNSRIYTWQSSDIGKMHTFVATYNSPTLSFYHNGTLVNDSTVTTDGGITAVPSIGDNGFGINGAAPGGGVNQYFQPFGAAASETTVVTAAEVAVWHSLVKQVGDIVPLRGMQYMWSTRRGLRAVNATWTDLIGGVVLARDSGYANMTVQQHTSWVW